MNCLKNLILISLIFIADDCLAQSFTVSSKVYIHLPLRGEKSYQLLHNYDSLDINSYYLNEPKLKHVIENEITSALVRLGYQMKNDASILVNYQILNMPARLRGANTFGRSLNPNDTTSTVYNVDPGTLVISAFDSATKKIAWRGFASGLIDCQLPRKNVAMIKEAVRLVMQEYANALSSLPSQ